MLCCVKKQPSPPPELETKHECSAFTGCAAETNAAFCGDLPQPLLPGHCIDVTGVPSKFCERFEINFTCGEDKNSDIVLHFNPRLIENYVVRNSRHHGKWNSEDTASHLQLDLRRNSVFRISFFIAPKKFMIAINGEHFCSFPFRIPLHRAVLIDVQGDVRIDDVEINEMSSYPDDRTMDINLIPFSDTYDGKTALPNPFIGQLNRGFQSGWQMEIYGKVKMLPHSFYINLQEGRSLWPHPNIPLHLNLRFNTPGYGNILIRNSWNNGSWGSEERSPMVYFSPSKPFHVIIQLDLGREMFIVWVNKRLQGDFRVRNQFATRNMDSVYIQGDVIIYKVFMQEKFTNVFEDLEEEI